MEFLTWIVFTILYLVTIFYVRFLQIATTIQIGFTGEQDMATFIVGQTIVATASEQDAAGLIVPIVALGLTWTSSDPSIASSVTNADGTATFTAVAPGDVTVTVTDAANGLTTGGTLTVTAKPDVATSISISFGTPQ